MNCAAKFVHSDCGGRQSKGQTPPKKWGNPGFTQMQGFTASEIVGFFSGPHTAPCLGLLEPGGSFFVWIYQLSDHLGLVSLAHGDVGFLLAAGWWLKRGWIISPSHRKSTTFRGQQVLRENHIFFKANCHWKGNISSYIQFQQLVLDFNLRCESCLKDLLVYAKPSMG